MLSIFKSIMLVFLVCLIPLVTNSADEEHENKKRYHYEVFDGKAFPEQLKSRSRFDKIKTTDVANKGVFLMSFVNESEIMRSGAAANYQQLASMLVETGGMIAEDMESVVMNLIFPFKNGSTVSSEQQLLRWGLEDFNKKSTKIDDNALIYVLVFTKGKQYSPTILKAENLEKTPRTKQENLYKAIVINSLHPVLEDMDEKQVFQLFNAVKKLEERVGYLSSVCKEYPEQCSQWDPQKWRKPGQ